jgi:hypothetical protein
MKHGPQPELYTVVVMACTDESDVMTHVIPLCIHMSLYLQVFDALSGGEQLGLMSSLGSYQVWASLGAPDGLHFRLDLTQAEQRDVAREVVKVCLIRHTAV